METLKKTSSKIEDCPCIKCLVKVQCRSKLIRRELYNKKKYLKFEYIKTCHLVRDYFYKKYSEDESLLEFHFDFFSRIKKFCQIHKISSKTFVWVGNELRIKPYLSRKEKDPNGI